jgi:hypothetical protein
MEESVKDEAVQIFGFPATKSSPGKHELLTGSNLPKYVFPPNLRQGTIDWFSRS